MKVYSFNIIFFFFMLFSFSEMHAQSDNKLKSLQEISLEKSAKKKKEKNKSKNKKSNAPQNDFIEIDSLVSISFNDNIDNGDIFDLSWGDPIANPKIRCDKASNLYGPVRHNSDGSVRWHRGFDYSAPRGTAVFSVGAGVVSSVENLPDYGLCVLVTHKRRNKTYYSFYAHLSSTSVKYGDPVQKGTVLGKSGTSGNASNLTGEDEHLHFEYRTIPEHGAGHQADPNSIVRTKFYSADPKNSNQSDVGVIKKRSDVF